MDPEVVQRAGARVVEVFGEVGAAPDDLLVARAADEALQALDELLADR